MLKQSSHKQSYAQGIITREDAPKRVLCIALESYALLETIARVDLVGVVSSTITRLATASAALSLASSSVLAAFSLSISSSDACARAWVVA
jgi:hypothetical protein